MRAGFAGKVARFFIDSKLTPLIIAASLGLGALALLATQREEEPQIRVPMVDVVVAWPGAEPAEIESRIVAPIERMLWGVPGVEHIYSASRPGLAMVTVRFKVNESNEASLVKVYERQSAMGFMLPRDIQPPIVELHSVDDVPFLTLTLWGEGWSSDRLSTAYPFRRGGSNSTLTFLTTGAGFFSRSYSGPSPPRSEYRALTLLADVPGFDLYPLGHCSTDLSAVYDAQREFVQLAGGAPTFQWIETGPIRPEYCGGVAMTPEELRAEVWLAVVGGARGSDD